MDWKCSILRMERTSNIKEPDRTFTEVTSPVRCALFVRALFNKDDLNRRKCLDRKLDGLSHSRETDSANFPVLRRRNPILLFRLSGELLLRFADRLLLALLFHEPPRLTRLEPLLTRPPGSFIAQPASGDKSI